MSNTDAFPLLRKGWSRQKVNQEQIRLATPLVEQGVQKCTAWFGKNSSIGFNAAVQGTRVQLR